MQSMTFYIMATSIRDIFAMATDIIVEMAKFEMATTKTMLRRETIVVNGHYN
jgi:hypothetical protein